MRVELQAAYVLHTRPFRDTSLLVDVFSKEYGRLTLIAKGARNPKQKIRQLIQPFIPLLISWQGKGELKTLIGIESDVNVPHLKNHYLYSAFYANELMMYLLAPGDPTLDIYVLYKQLLDHLELECDLEEALRNFEFSLLRELGYGIDFERDAISGGQINSSQRYAFDSQLGFILENDFLDHYNSNDTELVFFEGDKLLAIGCGDYSDVLTKKYAKIISRLALSYLLQGKKIKSRELFS